VRQENTFFRKEQQMCPGVIKLRLSSPSYLPTLKVIGTAFQPPFFATAFAPHKDDADVSICSSSPLVSSLHTDFVPLMLEALHIFSIRLQSQALSASKPYISVEQLPRHR
jgi:hypothetical protein